MKKLLKLLGIILITSNAAGPLVANKPNNKAKIKNSIETLTRQKRQAPKKQGKDKKPKPTSTPQQNRPSTSTTDNQVDFIKKEITLNKDYTDNIQNMLEELRKEKHLNPLRTINMGGLISTTFDNRDALIEILTKLDKKMANWIKEQRNNKEKILILTLKNSDNDSIKLVINLGNFYVQGFINNRNHYFYFKDSQVKEIKDKNLNIQESINLGYDSNYSHLIPEADLIISYENINDSIITLSKNTKEKNIKNLKIPLARLVFITSEAMRFQCDEKTLEIFSEVKNIDELKEIKTENKNILKAIQKIIDNSNGYSQNSEDGKIEWSVYKKQINNWNKYSETLNKFRIEIWEELKQAKKYFNFINNSKSEINQFLKKLLDDNIKELNETFELAKKTNLIKKINEYDLDNEKNQIIDFLISIKGVMMDWKNKLNELFPLKNWKELKIIHFEFLHLTIFYHNLDLFKLLIITGVNVNMQDENGFTPLKYALDTNNVEMVKLLIENGADVNMQDKNGITPLYSAIDTNNVEMADLLIENGADVNFLDSNNVFISPLYFAILKSNKKMVEVLLKSKNVKNGINNIGYLNMGCLHWVILKSKNILNNLEMVKILIEKGADVNMQDKNGITPLYSAIDTNNKEMVELLIEKGADVKNISKNGLTPLYYAINTNNKEMVELLIEKGADVNMQDKNGITPLHNAIDTNNVEMVELLIKKGANVDIKITSEGATLLHYAILNNKKEMVELLIKKGAGVNKGVNGLIPLYYAINTNKKEMVELLIEKGADVNFQDENDFSPLYYAINKENIEIVKLLLANDADVNLQNKNGLTPLLYSKYNKYIKIENLLENFIQLKQELITSESKNKIKHIEESIKKLLKIELSDVITRTELGEISDNSIETILNRVIKINYNLDINKVKVQENSITDTAATIEPIDQSVYFDGTVKVTFTLAKKSSNPSKTQKTITKDEYKKQGARPKGSVVILQNQPAGSSKRVSVGEQDGTSGPQNQKTIVTNHNNLYDVPADGSCLFWSIATSYLVPVRNNNEEFRNRFIQLFGELQLSYLSYVQTLLQQFDLSNTNNFLQAWYQDATAHRLVRVVFRNLVVDYIERNLDNPTQRNTNRDGELTFRSLIQENNEIASNYLERMRQSPTWGGTPEILAMSNLINTNINVNTSVNYNDYYQPINPNSNNNNITISYVELEKGSGIHNHYNFGFTDQTIAPIISNTNLQEKTTNVQNKQKLIETERPKGIPVISNQSAVSSSSINVSVNKTINTNNINSQISTTTKAINKYNSLSKEEKLKRLNEINRYYQTLPENDKKAFKEKLTNTGLAALSGGALTAYGTKMTISGTAATSVTNAEAMEMTPLLSTSTTESLAAAETITVAETAAVEGGVIVGETGTAAALAPETLGLSLVIGGLAIAGTWMYFAFHHHATSDIALPASIHHNVYDNIEKWYKFLAHDKLKIKINKNTWNEIKQNKNSQPNITKIIKNKFIISDHSGWGGSVTNEDFNTLVKVILLHFEQINGYFEILDNENDGFVIITNTEGDWLGIE